MMKRVSADMGVHDDGLRKLVRKIDTYGDGMIQFEEYTDFVEAKEERLEMSRGPQPLMPKSKVCAIRERLREVPCRPHVGASDSGVS